MRPVLTVAVCLFSAAAAAAQERFVERTPLPRHPQGHTEARAGTTTAVAPWAIPGVTRFQTGGYVGGGSLHGNNVRAKGPFVAPGPTRDGTFGWDFAGFKMRPGRVFLAPSADPSRGSMIARNYRTDGPHVFDVFTLRPFRRAVLEKREAVGGHGHQAGPGDH